MNLSEKEVKEYKEFLKQHKKDLEEFVPVLGPRALRFADLVMMVMEKRDMSERHFAKTFHCSTDTIYSILKVIRKRKLPFKWTERLECRRMERFLDGHMTNGALQVGFVRYRKKHASQIDTSVSKSEA